MHKIKKGDKVVVLVGKDKGKQGIVLKTINNVLKQKGQILKSGKVIVEGINLVKKHKKADPSKNSPGSIVEKEMAMDISNIALFNPSTNKADKIGFKFINQDNKLKKVRYFKSNQEVVVDV